MLLGGLAALGSAYVFLQSPPLWFVRPTPWAIPASESADERVLVIAPHPDDDVLGVGSSIEIFRRQGASVLVVFLTSGDANLAGQRLITWTPFRFAFQFRAIGARRQKEAVVALGRLGVPPENAIFLNYPDRGLASLVTQHWQAVDPFRSPYTKCAAKYQSEAFNPGSPYCGEELVEDLKEILAAFRPTIVYIPHPLDAHGDHRAGHSFARAAIRDLMAGDLEFVGPDLRCYLVHTDLGTWPTPSRVSSILAMVAPEPLFTSETWHSATLTPEAIRAKYRALRAHASQWWTSGSFLARFVCSNELYMVESS